MTFETLKRSAVLPPGAFRLLLAAAVVVSHASRFDIGRLAVLPEARGLGVAKLLIGAVEADARSRGLPGVRLGVRVVLTANQKLFQSLGYVETSRDAHPGFDYPTSINMRKSLE